MEGTSQGLEGPSSTADKDLEAGYGGSQMAGDIMVQGSRAGGVDSEGGSGDEKIGQIPRTRREVGCRAGAGGEVQTRLGDDNQGKGWRRGSHLVWLE